MYVCIWQYVLPNYRIDLIKKIINFLFLFQTLTKDFAHIPINQRSKMLSSGIVRNWMQFWHQGSKQQVSIIKKHKDFGLLLCCGMMALYCLLNDFFCKQHTRHRRNMEHMGVTMGIHDKLVFIFNLKNVVL